MSAVWDSLPDSDARRIISEYESRLGLGAEALRPEDIRALLGAAATLGFIAQAKDTTGSGASPKPSRSRSAKRAETKAQLEEAPKDGAGDHTSDGPPPKGTVIMAWTNTPVVATYELMPEHIAQRSAASKSDWVRVASFGNEHTAYRAFVADYDKCTLCSLWVRKQDLDDGKVCKNCHVTSKAAW